MAGASVCTDDAYPVKGFRATFGEFCCGQPADQIPDDLYPLTGPYFWFSEDQ
jgi:hypothetical protein